MISTRNLSELPSPADLQLRMQEMAALTAVFDIDYGDPTYAYYPKWTKHQQVGAVKNGSGDELFVHFKNAGCFIKGFGHESAMTPHRNSPPALWPKLLDNVPIDFKSSLNEPAFDMPNTTFVVWRQADDAQWKTGDIDYPEGKDPDGSTDLLSRLLLGVDEFTEWLADNYDVEVDAPFVAHVFGHKPLSVAQLQQLNEDAPVHSLRSAVEQTAYPLA